MANSTHHDDYQRLLALLKQLRRESGVTQVELGQRLGNTQTFVSKFERGERRIDVVEFVEICEALGADPGSAFATYLIDRARPPGGRNRKLGAPRRVRP